MWERRVAEWDASGEASATFSRGKGYSASALRYWARRLEQEGRREHRVAETPVRIARVVREGDDGAGPIVVEVGAVRVSVGRGFDRAVLQEVLEVLRALETGGER
jgi:hypothetical protein